MTRPRSRLLLLAVLAAIVAGCSWLRQNPEVVTAAEQRLDLASEACTLIANARDRRLCEVLAAVGEDATRTALEAALEGESCPAPSATPPPAASSPPPDPASSPPATGDPP